MLNDKYQGENYVLKWAVKNRQDIIETAAKWNLTPQQLIIEMLDDALEAYKKLDLKD